MSKKKIELQITQLKTDPSQYKIFDATLTPKDLYVEVEVEAQSFRDGLLLTPAGLAEVTHQIADAFDAMEIKFRKSQMERRR